MKFDLTDLKIFLAAVEGGSFTAAAADNNIVVAAVSGRLRRLETSFGLDLFERTGRGIKPTLAGQKLVRHARKIVDDARKAELELDEFSLGRSGQVNLLSNTNMLAEHLPHALGTFLAANPHVDVSVSDRPSLEVVNMLKNGDADIGVVAGSADMTGLERSPFVPDRLVLITPQDWRERLATSQPVAFSRILDFPMIGLQAKAALSQFLRRLANELGREPTVRARAEGFESLCRMVEAGAGIGIVPQSAARRYQAFIRYDIREIGEAWAERELYLCVRNELQMPRYTLNLLNHLRVYAQQVRLAASESQGPSD